jgi:hypothetical protein
MRMMSAIFVNREVEGFGIEIGRGGMLALSALEDKTARYSGDFRVGAFGLIRGCASVKLRYALIPPDAEIRPALGFQLANAGQQLGCFRAHEDRL